MRRPANASGNRYAPALVVEVVASALKVPDQTIWGILGKFRENVAHKLETNRVRQRADHGHTYVQIRHMLE